MSSITPASLLDNVQLSIVNDEKAGVIDKKVAEYSKKHNLQNILNTYENGKGRTGVLITSCVVKVVNPSQDVRYHQANLPNGYSGRVFDSVHTQPWLRKNGYRFASKETAWLTRTWESNHPYDSDYPLKKGNKQADKDTLNLLNALGSDALNADSAKEIIYAVLGNATSVQKGQDALQKKAAELVQEKTVTPSEYIEQVRQLTQQTTGKGKSVLPVAILFAVEKTRSRFSGMEVCDRKSHYASDSKSKELGDVMLRRNAQVTKTYEVKDDKPVTDDLVEETRLKNTEGHPAVILSTHVNTSSSVQFRNGVAVCEFWSYMQFLASDLSTEETGLLHKSFISELNFGEIPMSILEVIEQGLIVFLERREDS